MRLKQRGSLPGVSDMLGHDVRTNSESIVGVRFPGTDLDMSKGIAIGSGSGWQSTSALTVLKVGCTLVSTTLGKYRPPVSSAPRRWRGR